MIERKIQKVGSSSFSVSLPKEWVLKSSLGKNASVFFQEAGDGTLVVFPARLSEKKSLANFMINVEEQSQNISQILYAAYYLGAEHITIFSSKEIPSDVKSRIKESIGFMSGTEIEIEEAKKIELSVLLDKTKINVNNVLFRIGIVISASIDNCLVKIDLKEIERNEIEIDRLFHLASKIIIISSNNQQILKSSGIMHNSFIVPYLLISKKLENIADEIEDIAQMLEKKAKTQKELRELFLLAKEFISNHTKFSEKARGKEILVSSKEEKQQIEDMISMLEDHDLCPKIRTIFRYIYDITEELVNLSFYHRMVKEKIL